MSPKAQLGSVVAGRYRLALGLVACLSTAAFLALFATVPAAEKRTELVRLVAGQQAVSQRIAFLANAYAAAAGSVRAADYRRELDRSIQRMARVHDLMLKRRESREYDSTILQRIDGLFLAGNSPFDDQVVRFLDHAKAFRDLPAEEVREDHPLLLAVNFAGTHYVPQGFRQISGLLEDEGRRTVRDLQRFGIVAWLSTLVLLGLEALLIFRPLARRVRQTVVSLAAAEAEARAAASRAEEAMRAKARFLATMSHEIRTPLNAVIGTTGILLESRLDERARSYVRMARDAGEHLLGLVNNILDLNKLEAGRIDLDEHEFSPHGEIRRAAAMVAPNAEKKGLSIGIACEPEVSATVLGDSGRLRQVLVNLVGNAVKFTETGSVDIAAEMVSPAGGTPARGDTVELAVRVSDTGIGIAAHDLPRLFEDFQQLDSGHARVYEGTGLGLAISRRLVELMGGRIGVDSKPGEGSTFWFRIPFRFVAAGETAIAAPPPAAEPATGERALSILVAEDNPANQAILRHVLERIGHRVEVAGDGEEAVGKAASGRFDVVLMDVEMPVLDGLEAMRRARRLPGPAAQVPIIAMTGHAMDGDREKLLAAGFDGHLAKPIDAVALSTLLASIRPPAGTAAEGVASAEAEPRLFNAETFHRLTRISSPDELEGMVGSVTASLDTTLAKMRQAAERGNWAELRELAHGLASGAAAIGGERLAFLALRVERAPNPSLEFSASADFLAGYGRETAHEVAVAMRGMSSAA